MLTAHYEIFPYVNMLDLFRTLFISNSLQDDSQIFDVDPSSLITIHNKEDVIQKRNSLINYIWKGQYFPTQTLPTKIEREINESQFADLTNISHIDKITISMKYDVNSYSYLIVGKNDNQKLVIYHHGHAGDFMLGKNTIQNLLNEGYSVLAFSMPLIGMNNQPEINIPNIGKLKLTSHYYFWFLESNDFSPIQYFLDPIVISLNYVEKQYQFDSINMIGISGGGWTTVIYSALDERVSQSYSIAGSLPIFLRSNQNDIGDYEQILPELYNIANYLDLYIMSSYGDNRKFVQIFNKFDPCCFSGERAKIYSDEIQSTLSKLGKGEFEIHIDDTHKNHKISNHALEIILNDMK